MQDNEKIIVIGGSAGCLPVLVQLLQNLPAGYAIPVIIVLHRLRNVQEGPDKIINIPPGGLRLREPEDKEAIQPGFAYFAPANYHLLVEADKTFSLDYSEPVQYCRPSIDVSFESAADVFGAGTIAILLGGANRDGARGIGAVLEKQGMAIVQQPESCQYAAMPKAAIHKNPGVLIYNPAGILQYLNCLHLQ
jgi:two-component system chemotaxis response regulator CheB